MLNSLLNLYPELTLGPIPLRPSGPHNMKLCVLRSFETTCPEPSSQFVICYFQNSRSWAMCRTLRCMKIPSVAGYSCYLTRNLQLVTCNVIFETESTQRRKDPKTQRIPKKKTPLNCRGVFMNWLAATWGFETCSVFCLTIKTPPISLIFLLRFRVICGVFMRFGGHAGLS